MPTLSSPESEPRKFPHNTQAADLCRVLIVLQEGGWYVDLDTVCLRAFNFPEPYVFVSEDPSKYGKQKSTKIPLTPCLETVTNAIPNNIFKAPAGSPFLQYVTDQYSEPEIHFILTIGPFSDRICL